MGKNIDILMQCKMYTNLTPAQAQLLENIHRLLPFAEALTGQEVYLFSRAKEEQIFLHDALHRRMEERGKTRLLAPYEVPLWETLLQCGTMVSGKQERGFGQLCQMNIFPIVDNGGKVVGGLSFVATQSEGREETANYLLAETAYMTMMVPDWDFPKLYKPMSFHDGLIIFDESGTILYANELAARVVDLFGFDRRLVGTSVFGGTLKLSMVKEAIAKHRGNLTEEIYGDLILEQRIIPVISGGRMRRCLLILEDKTAKRKQEQEMLVKNSVIKEIHHRVKNNLQTVAGLLRMEARQSDSGEVKNVLLESVRRIESMALVHEMVSHYEEDYISLRKVGEEILRLSQIGMAQPQSHIIGEYSGDNINLTSRQASYISLIINELVSNCFVHAFKEQAQGLIRITAVAEDDKIVLTVCDNGKGLPENFDPYVSKRLGLKIIRNLVDNELQGVLHFEGLKPQGTKVTIVFQKDE